MLHSLHVLWIHALCMQCSPHSGVGYTKTSCNSSRTRTCTALYHLSNAIFFNDAFINITVGYYANPGKCTGIRIVFCVVLVIVLCLYCLYAVLLLLCNTVIVLLCYYLCCPMYWSAYCTTATGCFPIAVDKYIYLYLYLAMSGKLE